MKDSFSYYDILGIPKQASDDDIKRAYLSLAKKYHPDQNPQNRRLAAQWFQIVLEAYNAIKTREKRAIYNSKLRTKAMNDNKGRKNSKLFSNIGEWFRPEARTARETRK